MKKLSIILSILLFLSIAISYDANAQGYSSCSNIPCSTDIFEKDSIITVYYGSCPIKVEILWRQYNCSGTEYYEVEIKKIAHYDGCPQNGTLDLEEVYQKVHKEMIKGVYELFYQNNVPFKEFFHLFIYQPKCVWEDTFVQMEEMEISSP